MAPKNRKKTSTSTGPVSAKTYFQSGQARKLPIHACFVTEQWQTSGMVQVIVSRRHVTGNITTCFYLVDLLCAGVKDSMYIFNEPEDSLNEIKENIETKGVSLESCDYALAHNIIFAGLEFAAEYGIEPIEEFAITKMMLEEDDETIELIDVECGKDGQPFLVDNGYDPRIPYYLRQLKKNAGEGNYQFVVGEGMPGFDDEEYNH
jgi:hypothetical protein